jgi:hypothetical protein
LSASQTAEVRRLSLAGVVRLEPLRRGFAQRFDHPPLGFRVVAEEETAHGTSPTPESAAGLHQAAEPTTPTGNSKLAEGSANVAGVAVTPSEQENSIPRGPRTLRAKLSVLISMTGVIDPV